MATVIAYAANGRGLSVDISTAGYLISDESDWLLIDSAVDYDAGEVVLQFSDAGVTKFVVAYFADFDASGVYITGMDYRNAAYELMGEITGIDTFFTGNETELQILDGDDLFLGNNYGDYVGGTLGNDTVIGNAGADSLNGGAANDSLDGGYGSDLLRGNSGDDILIGQHGDDWLFGGLGNDTVYGGSGDDRVVGRAGFDLLYGGDGLDYMLGGTADDTIFGGTGNDSIYAGIGDDIVDGGGGNDLIFGRAGDDTLTGGDGDDTLYGGAGADLYVAGAGSDIFQGFAFADGDRISLSGTWTTADNQNGDAVVTHSQGNITLVGITAGTVDPTWFS